MNKKPLVIIALAITAMLINFYISHKGYQITFLIFSVVTALIIFCLFYRYKWLRLDDKNLFVQPLFLCSILLPLYYCIIFGFWAWKGHHLNLSPKGFTNFIIISKLPLLILASSVPLASIINNIHRTIQTEMQIHEAQIKNKFDMSINHLKYYTELFKKVETDEISEQYQLTSSDGKTVNNYKIEFKPSVHYPSALYKKIYSQLGSSNKPNLESSNFFLAKLNRDWKYLNFCFKKLQTYNLRLIETHGYEPISHKNFRAVKCKFYFEICNAYETLCRTLELTGYRPKVSFTMEDLDKIYQIWIPFNNFNTLYNAIKILEKISLQILDIINDENVSIYFSADKKLFRFGPGVLHKWQPFMSLECVMDDTPPSISYTASHNEWRHFGGRVLKTHKTD